LCSVRSTRQHLNNRNVRLSDSGAAEGSVLGEWVPTVGKIVLVASSAGSGCLRMIVNTKAHPRISESLKFAQYLSSPLFTNCALSTVYSIARTTDSPDRRNITEQQAASLLSNISTFFPVLNST